MRTISRHGKVVNLIDQTRLPLETVEVPCATVDALCESIRSMRIRGAPALGVAGAYAMALAAEAAPDSPEDFARSLARFADQIRGTRPTAVNLAWGVDRALAASRMATTGGIPEAREELWRLADWLAEADIAANQRLGAYGATLIPDGARILTHCNTGSLATVDWGTALGMVRSAHRDGKRLHVFVDETRPFLQGSRLTAWELEREGVPYTVITDNMAGALMARGEVDLCLVGADRIAACGDVANKIGTYAVAVLAHAHDIPFYVGAPTSSVDLAIETGAEIPIEERDPDEVLAFAGIRVAPTGATARHPAFDVTPARLVSAIVTEMGVLRAPYESALADAVTQASKAESGDAVSRPAAHGAHT
jgi:methylthioribose-1-phosphate isomerase